MSLDAILPDIEQVRADGGFVFLKWDGERTSHRITVIVENPGTEFIFRKDTDDLVATVVEGIAMYWEFLGNS